MDFNFGHQSTPKTTANNPLNPGNAQTTSAGFPILGNQPSQSGFPLGSSNIGTSPKTGIALSGSSVFNIPSSTTVPVSTPATFPSSFPSMLSKPAVSTPNSGFSFKTATTAAVSSGIQPAITSGSLTFGTTTSATVSVPTLNFTTSATPTTTLSFASPSTTTVTSAPGLNFGLQKTTSALTSTPFPSLKSTITTTSSVTTTTSVGLSSTQPTSAVSTITLTGSSKPIATSGTSQLQSTTFQELEEGILNKLTSELIEQEKVFLNQANQINTWDKIINDNTEKLKQLHTIMEKVRKQQIKIKDDLEVISTHQKDLENSLLPMEKENFPLPAHKTDPNRKNLYMNATNIDSQIKRMSEDLKETIEQINETSRLHDTEDPVIQIGRILNAHMESLKWIDEHTSKMQDYLDSLLKVHDNLRRECDILNKIEGY